MQEPPIKIFVKVNIFNILGIDTENQVPRFAFAQIDSEQSSVTVRIVFCRNFRQT
jgi:hypothetical protein